MISRGDRGRRSSSTHFSLGAGEIYLSAAPMDSVAPPLSPLPNRYASISWASRSRTIHAIQLHRPGRGA